MSSLPTSDAPSQIPPRATPPQVSPKDGSSTRAAGVVGIAVMCSRVLGLVREMTISSLFGGGLVTDVFVAAFQAPNLLRDLFAEGALSTAFITTFSKKIQSEGDASAWRLANKMATLTLVFMSGVTLLGMLLAPWLTELLSHGYHQFPGKFEMTVSLTRVMFPFILMVSLAALAMGMLNAKHVFGAPAMASTFFNLGSIIGGVSIGWALDRHFGAKALYGLAIGTLIGGFLQLIVQFPSLHRVGYRFRPDFDWKDEGVRTILRLMGPAVIAASAVQVNVMVNASFASSLANGSRTFLNNSFRLMQLPLGIFGVAIATVTLPLVSRSIAAGDRRAFCSTLARGLRLAFFFTIPSAVGLICLGNPIIGLIYGHKKFTITAVHQTGAALQFYAIGLAAYSGIKVLAPAFYALEARNTPMTVSFIAIGINLVLNAIFTRWLEWGHRGLAFSTSLTAVINFTLLYILMQRRTGSLESRQMVVTMCKLTVAGLALATVCLLGNRVLLHGFDYFSVPEQIAGLFTVVGVGAAAFFGVCHLLQLEEMDEAVGIFTRKLRRRRASP